MTEARTLSGQHALELFNRVQLAHEMGWTEAEIDATSDDFIWACLNVLDLEGEKANEEAERSRRGGGYASKPGAVEHHRANQPPERVP